MTPQRTGGMTAIGILNVVFGSIGTVLSLLVVLGGGLVAAAGGAAMQADRGANGAELGVDATEFGGAVAAGGGLIMLIGVVGAVCWALLGVSGLGVLNLRSWGRTLSILCGAALIALNGFALVQNGFGLLTVGFIIYGGLLIGLFSTANWKAAFRGEAQTPSVGLIGQDDFQQAA